MSEKRREEKERRRRGERRDHLITDLTERLTEIKVAFCLKKEQRRERIIKGERKRERESKERNKVRERKKRREDPTIPPWPSKSFGYQGNALSEVSMIFVGSIIYRKDHSLSSLFSLTSME